MSATTDGLVLADVRAGYGETIVIDGVSLTLRPGATLALPVVVQVRSLRPVSVTTRQPW